MPQTELSLGILTTGFISTESHSFRVPAFYETVPLRTGPGNVRSAADPVVSSNSADHHVRNRTAVPVNAREKQPVFDTCLMLDQEDGLTVDQILNSLDTPKSKRKGKKA